MLVAFAFSLMVSVINVALLRLIIECALDVFVNRVSFLFWLMLTVGLANLMLMDY